MAVVPKSGENKRAHLKMIQGVINRMASNQFLFKGWSVTLIAAITAFTAKDSSPALMAIPVVATLLFWAVDAYYLMLERAYRNLYDLVTTKTETDIDFKMKADASDVKLSKWFLTLWRPILVIFYGVVIAALIVLIFALNHFSIRISLHHG